MVFSASRKKLFGSLNHCSANNPKVKKKETLSVEQARSILRGEFQSNGKYGSIKNSG
ncbi:hypothetical protein LEP1GSC043_4776 [Leptospira weilii str. Ecochallenge]|uniref:Uncharacterized protein n=1 Tax=Leptospira weilii str. Ecochallenge TaxID=1049986 RepID=N1U618_9LEPT|nr:hypothetical protein LEP1GSC043_4776 [Leptospira weilii str. Ecochallenge]